MSFTYRRITLAAACAGLGFLTALGACGDHGSGSSTPTGSSSGGQPGSGTSPPAASGTFTDDFSWSGVQGAVVNGGQGTAVFLDANQWDVTGDTHAIAVMGEWSDTPAPNAAGLGLTNTNSGHTVYVHRAKTPCDASKTGPCDGAIDDTSRVPGGDGSAGVAVFQVDGQDIVGARLRNPMVLTEDKPGVVELRAPRFVTLGHWWELALTPADRVIGAESTVVESQGQQDGLGDPGGEANAPGKGAGPGHDPQEESFNVVVTGASDFACTTQLPEQGSLTRIAVKSLMKKPPAGLSGGYQTASGYRYNAFNPKSLWDGAFYGNYTQNLIRPGLDGRSPLPASFLDSTGAEIAAKVDAENLGDEDKLYLWRFEFRPSGVDVFADLDDGQGLSKLEHFDLGVPWPEVHVHLMAVAYQNDHHPQVQPCYVPNPYTQRDLRFGTVSVSPVVYSSVSVFPPDDAKTDADGNVLLCNGESCGRWMRYDMRDTHTFGAPDVVTVNGESVSLPRPNAEKFAFARDYAHGSSDHFQGGLAPETSFDLYVPLGDDVTKAKAATFVYNVLGAHGVARLSVNGHDVGALPTADSVIGASIKNDVATDPGCPDYDCMSVRRSLSFDASLLAKDAQNGLAHLVVTFDPANLGSGTFLDRIQLEVMR